MRDGCRAALVLHRPCTWCTSCCLALVLIPLVLRRPRARATVPSCYVALGRPRAQSPRAGSLVLRRPLGRLPIFLYPAYPVPGVSWFPPSCALLYPSSSALHLVPIMYPSSPLGAQRASVLQCSPLVLISCTRPPVRYMLPLALCVPAAPCTMPCPLYCPSSRALSLHYAPPCTTRPPRALPLHYALPLPVRSPLHSPLHHRLYP